MKRFFSLLLTSVFIVIFLVGVIGLIIPFNFEKFSYDQPTTHNNKASTNYAIKFDIDNNADEDFENVILNIKYITNSGFSSYNTFEKEIVTTLKKEDNEITFLHTEGKASTLYKIESIDVTMPNGDKFKIYSGTTLLAGINAIFFGLTVVGFFGSAISIAISLSKKKKEEFEETDTRTFNQKIRDAFAPVADTINTLKQTYEESKRNIQNNNTNNKEEEPKPKKITCPYCKGKYSSTEDRCPHCGAPPEPCD